MWVRLISYFMASVAIAASFLFGHNRVLRFMDRHLPLHPKRPPVRPVISISRYVIDERTAAAFGPAEMMPPPMPPENYGSEHRV